MSKRPFHRHSRARTLTSPQSHRHRLPPAARPTPARHRPSGPGLPRPGLYLGALPAGCRRCPPWRGAEGRVGGAVCEGGAAGRSRPEHQPKPRPLRRLTSALQRCFRFRQRLAGVSAPRVTSARPRDVIISPPLVTSSAPPPLRGWLRVMAAATPPPRFGGRGRGGQNGGRGTLRAATAAGEL